MAHYFADAADCMWRLAQVAADDAYANKIGAQLAEALGVKRDTQHPEGWATTYGWKTDAGLARTALRILMEAQ
jgi:hypothetical protein